MGRGRHKESKGRGEIKGKEKEISGEKKMRKMGKKKGSNGEKRKQWTGNNRKQMRGEDRGASCCVGAEGSSKSSSSKSLCCSELSWSSLAHLAVREQQDPVVQVISDLSKIICADEGQT